MMTDSFLVVVSLGDIRHNTRKEMIKEVEDFAAEITALVEKLKAKHSTERLRLLKTLKSKSEKKELEQFVNR